MHRVSDYIEGKLNNRHLRNCGCTKMACGGRVKLSDFGLNHGDASLFAKPQWLIHRYIYLAWRVFLALYLLSWLVFDLAIATNIGTFVVFLTDWTFLVLTLYAVSSCIGAVYFTFAHRSNRFYFPNTDSSQPENVRVQELGCNVTSTDELSIPPRRSLEGAVSPRLPHYFKFVWLLFNVCLAINPIVTAVYWSFLASQKSGFDLALDIHFHALNTVFIYADLLVSAIPVRVVHFVYPFLYGMLYISFSLVYYWSGGVNPHSGEAAIYPRFLDWSHAGWTVLSCFVTCLMITVVHFGGYGVYRLRDYIHGRMFGHRQEALNCNL